MILLDIQKLRKRLRIWSEDLERVPVIGKVVKKSKTWTLPGFQHLPLYDVMDYFFQSLGKGVIFQRAAALTYRIFIALVPIIIALFSVIAFLGEGVQQTLISLLQSVIPVYAWRRGGCHHRGGYRAERHTLVADALLRALFWRHLLQRLVGGPRHLLLQRPETQHNQAVAAQLADYVYGFCDRVGGGGPDDHRLRGDEQSARHHRGAGAGLFLPGARCQVDIDFRRPLLCGEYALLHGAGQQAELPILLGGLLRMHLPAGGDIVGFELLFLPFFQL